MKSGDSEILSCLWRCSFAWAADFVQPAVLYERFSLTVVILVTWATDFLEKLVFSELVKKFLAFYGTRMFIIMFTRSRLRPLSWSTWIQSTPYFPKIHSNIILPSTPRSSELSLRFGFSDQNFLRISRTLYWATWNQSTPSHYVCFWSVLILSLSIAQITTLILLSYLGMDQ
jgi:hypothetical protein